MLSACGQAPTGLPGLDIAGDDILSTPGDVSVGDDPGLNPPSDPGTTIDEGVQSQCTPDCAGRFCGPDGCGGQCGTCDDGNPCTQDDCSVDGVCDFLTLEECGSEVTCADGQPCPTLTFSPPNAIAGQTVEVIVKHNNVLDWLEVETTHPCGGSYQAAAVSGSEKDGVYTWNYSLGKVTGGTYSVTVHGNQEAVPILLGDLTVGGPTDCAGAPLIVETNLPTMWFEPAEPGAGESVEIWVQDDEPHAYVAVAGVDPCDNPVAATWGGVDELNGIYTWHFALGPLEGGDYQLNFSKDQGTVNVTGAVLQVLGPDNCDIGPPPTYPKMWFDPSDPTAGSTIDVFIQDTFGHVFVDIKSTDPCGVDLLGSWVDVQDSDGVFSWHFTLGPLTGGTYDIAFTKDIGTTSVVNKPLLVNGSTECGSTPICPETGQACEDHYPEMQTCAQTGEAVVVFCHKYGTCMAPGNGSQCSWGEGSYCDDPCSPPENICGDGDCTGGENCSNCASDCGDCPTGELCAQVGLSCEDHYPAQQTCVPTGAVVTVLCHKYGTCTGVGDGSQCGWGPGSFCDDPCAQQSQSSCGDNTCETSENCNTCEEDCGSCFSDLVCPEKDMACSEQYPAQQVCSVTGDTVSVTCFKQGNCLDIGDGTQCTWGPGSYCDDPCAGLSETPPPVNAFGIGLVGPGDAAELDLAKELAGEGGHVLLIFPGVINGMQGPTPQWIESVQGVYDRDMIPVVRLQAPWGQNMPRYDSDDAEHMNYATLAQAYRNVVQGLPKRDGWPLYIQVWNEPNLCYEWACEGGEWLSMWTTASEYAAFFRDVADAIHGIGDSRIKVSLGALAPGGNTMCHCCGAGSCAGQPGATGLDFMNQMATAVPGIWGRLDYLASHSYPASNIGWGFFQPFDQSEPGLNYFELELQVIGQSLPVLITETGWSTQRPEGGPFPSENQKAQWTKQAYEQVWLSNPKVYGVMPFILRDAFWGDQEGFGWVHIDGAHFPVFDMVRDFRCSLGVGGGC